MYSKELLKGTLKPLILKILSDKEEMYGYQIVQTLKEVTGGQILVREGSLYPILHSLKAEGILSCRSVFLGERERKYYSITEPGKASVKAALEELKNFVELLQSVITPLPSTIP
ncbi:PadR family transcriptional regulator [Spirosoma endophyticum]|uniref:Transcriptional regulator, PadR family n=1 Tax=Spirosoma endophyticum TaxID=662367 RepID=A0A1I2E6Y2_9BACT|nr:PadR family transcriptional regulator [Spirosoma endophyticum]SFE88734.1 transcriptional regulator, PadR family [Spirosoma endophyticum]